MNHPCYLFGQSIWELKPTELHASDKGLTLLFEEGTEKNRQQRNRLQHGLLGVDAPSDAQYIPEAVRSSVGRRDGGKCARCRSHEGVEFSVVGRSLRGNAPTAENVQLLCARCRGRQSPN